MTGGAADARSRNTLHQMVCLSRDIHVSVSICDGVGVTRPRRLHFDSVKGR